VDTSNVSDAGNDGDSSNQQQHAEQKDGGHSGEGAASALAHLKSQAKQHRHQTGEADDAAAGTGGHAQ
jgi:hypothetical protein